MGAPRKPVYPSDKFYLLEAVREVEPLYAPPDAMGHRRKYLMWEFKCECGKVVTRRLANVRSGQVKSCGCLNGGKRKKRMIKPGDQFWYLTIEAEVEPLRHTLSSGKTVVTRQCRFRCVCGNTIVHSLHKVATGVKQSCGCLPRVKESPLLADSVREARGSKTMHSDRFATLPAPPYVLSDEGRREWEECK